MNDLVYERVEDARFILGLLGFDPERTNERSARVLLALLHLTPEDGWTDATNPMLGTRAIMDWIRDYYGVDYAANSRETVRRFTLHQFAEALLVEQNPDRPGRPVNSPKWCYRVNPRALEVIRSYGVERFHALLDRYLADVPGLKAQYDAARKMERIPVTLSKRAAAVSKSWWTEHSDQKGCRGLLRLLYTRWQGSLCRRCG